MRGIKFVIVGSAASHSTVQIRAVVPTVDNVVAVLRRIAFLLLRRASAPPRATGPHAGRGDDRPASCSERGRSTNEPRASSTGPRVAPRSSFVLVDRGPSAGPVDAAPVSLRLRSSCLRTAALPTTPATYPAGCASRHIIYPRGHAGQGSSEEEGRVAEHARSEPRTPGAREEA